MAPRQPPLSPLRLPQAQAAPPPVRRDPFYEGDKLSSVDILDEASLCERQAHSELLDRIAKLCGLERSSTEDATKIIGMMNPPYYAPRESPNKSGSTLAWFYY